MTSEGLLTEGLRGLNSCSPQEAEADFRKCCGSSEWARRMAQLRPFATVEHLLDSASRVWEQLSESDWLEAFRHHPKIGERKAVASQASESSEWARREQAGTEGANAKLFDELSRANRKYEERFGFIFIVCATGKSAEEMLALLEQRLHNSPAVEIRIAAEEQSKITRLRLEKLLRGE
jgi:2-oxo-4-hydroxy-4-carboxy-5-ureidoimidazoline decarboxylase